MIARHALFLVIAMLIVPHMGVASNNTTVFPPRTLQSQECGSDQLRVISWAANASSTVCLTGQEVLTLAIPSCSANQQVVYDGSKYLCRSPMTIPTCTEQQYLSYNGSAYECKSSTPPPTCTASQVLTFNGSEYACVERSDAMPSCTASQFLTYNGNAFQCAENRPLTLPNCGADQYLTSVDGTATCVALPNNGATWSEVNLASTEQFNLDCMYRFTMPWTTPYFGTPWTPDLWMYPTGVGPDTLIFVAHSSAISHVNASSKSVYRVNGGSYPLPVTRMQQKCSN